MTFDIVSACRYNDGGVYSVAALCRNCMKSVGFLVDANPAGSLIGVADDRLFQSDYDVTDLCVILEIWPEPPKPLLPDYLSENVARAFYQAEDNRFRRNWDAAGIMFRKVLETSMKELGVECQDAKTLYQRIRVLKDNGRLTADLADWADHIRLLGNGAAHDVEEPDEAEITELADLTRMLLIYLFEMPGRIAAMRAQAAVGGAVAQAKGR